LTSIIDDVNLKTSPIETGIIDLKTTKYLYINAICVGKTFVTIAGEAPINLEAVPSLMFGAYGKISLNEILIFEPLKVKVLELVNVNVVENSTLSESDKLV
jgi:hypothetical protein